MLKNSGQLWHKKQQHLFGLVLLECNLETLTIMFQLQAVMIHFLPQQVDGSPQKTLKDVKTRKF